MPPAGQALPLPEAHLELLFAQSARVPAITGSVRLAGGTALGTPHSEWERWAGSCQGRHQYAPGQPALCWAGHKTVPRGRMTTLMQGDPALPASSNFW